MWFAGEVPNSRLTPEKSPYLLRHANNPVEWYPWGEEAFARARSEHKPIFLSIGYFTCRICQVMARELFENLQIAALMNQNFVCIKVDREERPDIDRIYGAYLKAHTGEVGWPLSVWLTPDLKPFAGGIHFAPDNGDGEPGFPRILRQVARSWRDRHLEILSSSDDMIGQLRAQTACSPQGPGVVETALLEAAFVYFRSSFDSTAGGFGNAPDLTPPSVQGFLLRYWKRTGDTAALHLVSGALNALSEGGRHDHLDGGFHRYSVEGQRVVPHFAKLLCDQAQLALSFLEAFQATGNESFALTARRTLDYVLSRLRSPEGAFWSAEDGGAFYLWTFAELTGLLGERAAPVAHRYGVTPEGNVHDDPEGDFTGRNILFAACPAEADLTECEAILLEARNQRPRPALDDRVLTAWNGLMISAFARAGAVFGHQPYVDAACQAADFLDRVMVLEDGRLLRRYRDGDAAIPGMLEDYAAFTGGLIDLYEVTGGFHHLVRAIALTDWQIAVFEDVADGGFYASAIEDANCLLRMKSDYDGCEPSGNSLALGNLLRLFRMTGNARYDECAQRLVAAMQSRLAETPDALPAMLAACELDLSPHRQVVIAGKLSEELARALWLPFDPNRITLHADFETAALQPGLLAMTPEAGEAAVYVCDNFVFDSPVTTPSALAFQMSRPARQEVPVVSPSQVSETPKSENSFRILRAPA